MNGNDKERLRQAVIVSDLHCGCRLGLAPPKPVTLDGGGTYSPSKLQRKVWRWWTEFWGEWVPMVTRGEPYAVVVNGDTTDGRHHNSVTQVSQNLVDQKRIALAVLRPIVAQCSGRFYMIRGTEAHVGQSGENEETLAEELGAIPDAEGNHARWDMWLNIAGRLAHISHHIGTTGRTHYESSAPMGELTQEYLEVGRWGGKSPDWVVRAHRHRHIEVKISTQHGDGIVVVTPGWQLKTPFVWKIQGGAITNPQFGGILLRTGDEEHFTRHKVWNVTRTQEVVL